MTTDVCEVCGGGLACGGRASILECRNYDGGGGYRPCANAERLAIERAAEIARLQAVNAELVAALNRCDPGPEWTIPEYCADGAYFCEISVGDIKAIRQALANATKEPS